MSGGTEACPACGASGTVQNGICERCGFAFAEANRCPHCKVITRVEHRVRRGETAWVCASCGGPRMPAGLGNEGSAKELACAKAADGRAARRTAGALGLSGLALVSLLLMLTIGWIAPEGALIAKIFAVIVTGVLALVATRGFVRAGRARREADAAIERAWLSAAEEVARRSRTLTAEDLSARLGVEVPRAEHLLSQLSVHGRTRVDIGEDARIHYSAPPDGALEDDFDEEASSNEELRR